MAQLWQNDPYLVLQGHHRLDILQQHSLDLIALHPKAQGTTVSTPPLARSYASNIKALPLLFDPLRNGLKLRLGALDSLFRLQARGQPLLRVGGVMTETYIRHVLSGLVQLVSTVGRWHQTHEPTLDETATTQRRRTGVLGLEVTLLDQCTLCVLPRPVGLHTLLEANLAHEQ